MGRVSFVSAAVLVSKTRKKLHINGSPNDTGSRRPCLYRQSLFFVLMAAIPESAHFKCNSPRSPSASNSSKLFALPKDSADTSDTRVYEWLCSQWEDCSASANSPRSHRGPSGIKAFTKHDATYSELVLPTSVALSCGLPASMGHHSARAGDAALRTLEESKRQREQQDALLQQADRFQDRAKRLQPKGEAIRRVGGVPSARETCSARAVSPNCVGNRSFSSASPASATSTKSERVAKTTPTKKANVASAFRQLASPKSSLPERQRRASSPVCAVGNSSASNSAGGGAGKSSATNVFTFQPLTRGRPQRSESPKLVSPRTLFPSTVMTADDRTTETLAEESSSVAETLLARGLLNTDPQPWNRQFSLARDDLAHIQALFTTQVPDAEVLGVFRIQNANLTSVYEAVRGTMEGPSARELHLWHGTTPECVRNIVISGFNRAYSGRHGTKFGHGTYFSSMAGYSLRFCGRQRKYGREPRVMLLARVLVGECVKGSPELVEPPYRDADHMKRFDSTVDDEESPNIFCIFRDFQALPQYLVEFARPA